MRQPTLFLPHGGGPCFFMDWTMGPADTWDPLRDWLAGLVETLPEPPTAVLVISAHWEARVPTLNVGAQPPLLFDYGGFPAHTYALTWPAPGAPALAERVAGLLKAAGLPHDQDSERGWDHGVFVPLKVVFPEPTLPTLQLSLQAGLDPATHLALGRALAPLRDEGVLILGSGMSFHNMGLFGHPDAGAVSRTFDAWLGHAVTRPPPERDAALEQWAQAPLGRAAHPRAEHLLPLHVCAGAAGADPGEVVFQDQVMGSAISAVRFG